MICFLPFVWRSLLGVSRGQGSRVRSCRSNSGKTSQCRNIDTKPPSAPLVFAIHEQHNRNRKIYISVNRSIMPCSWVVFLCWIYVLRNQPATSVRGSVYQTMRTNVWQTLVSMLNRWLCSGCNSVAATNPYITFMFPFHFFFACSSTTSFPAPLPEVISKTWVDFSAHPSAEKWPVIKSFCKQRTPSFALDVTPRLGKVLKEVVVGLQSHRPGMIPFFLLHRLHDGS